MGQKINPIGLRLGINRGWDSTWFAKKKDFGKYLIEDFQIRKYIKKNIVNSGVSEIIIERSSKQCTVSIHTSRPGFVIGKKGADIEKIKKNIMKITKGDDKLTLYQFYTNTAKHYFCSICGIFTHTRPRSNPKLHMINIACVEGVDPFEYKDVSINDGNNHPLDQK